MDRCEDGLVKVCRALAFSVPVGVIAVLIPWGAVFTPTLPAGGDNPAHPVLLASLREALLESQSIIHYSYRFWSGFELFQFYFPLPYLSGVFLSMFFSPHVAYKLVTVFGVIALPIAFAFATFSATERHLTALFAAFASLGFLFTDAHEMWGGNFWSNFAGMIGNAWSLVFFLLGFGQLYRSWGRSAFSPVAVVAIVLTMMSHFYATLILGLTFLVFCLGDLFRFVRGEVRFRQLIPFYVNGLLAIALMSWWLIPLVAYKGYSSEFGVNWEFSFLGTFTSAEKVAVVGAVGGIVIATLLKFPGLRFQWTSLLLVVLTGVLYLSSYVSPSVVLLNIRLWPLLYLALYLLIISGFDLLFRVWSRKLRAVLFSAVLFFLPSHDQLERGRAWNKLNHMGIEATPAWEDFHELLDHLRALPPARISFESAPRNNWVLGSIRTFELLPAITAHEAVEGGIVNSATYPGVAYSLQCMTSNSCAGWPYGTLIPAKDIPRAVELMRSLGVSYHIAGADDSIQELVAFPGVELIFRGKYLALFKILPEVFRVEVFDGPVPVFTAERPRLTLLNLLRWDRLRNTLYVFDPSGAKLPGEYTVNSVAFLNFLIDEWNAKRRVGDNGWGARDEGSVRYLNSYIYSWRRSFDLVEELERGLPDLFIGQRSFDPELLYSPLAQGDSEVATVLVRDEQGVGEVTIVADGYDAYIDGEKVPTGMPLPIDFHEQELFGERAPFVLVIFRTNSNQRFRSIDITTEDEKIRNGLPGPASLELPRNITRECTPELTLKFQQMILRTKCPERPHLIKYTLYPKWSSDVPIRLGPNGYMVVTPSSSELVLVHRAQAVDVVAQVITACGAVVFALLSFWRQDVVAEDV